MVIREARYLSGNDLGKQIELQGYSGTLEELEAFADTVIVRLDGVGKQFLLDMSTQVTITGKGQ